MAPLSGESPFSCRASSGSANLLECGAALEQTCQRTKTHRRNVFHICLKVLIFCKGGRFPLSCYLNALRGASITSQAKVIDFPVTEMAETTGSAIGTARAPSGWQGVLKVPDGNCLYPGRENIVGTRAECLIRS